MQLDQLAAFAEFESRTTSKRIRESNHSALLTSGKFNTHCPLLGFDALKNEHGEHNGFYKPNKAELKQVEWVMSSFLQVDRYKTLLEWCKEKNIKTKLGKNFTRGSIRRLLTNPRYIGKWYRNKQNADKRQNKLMPYERYAEVDLGHGCVIDKGLWQQVQDKVKELDGSRAQATKHCYPLSGLLVFTDGSNFTGSSAWGNASKSTYYHNKANKIRVRSEVFDAEAEKVLRHAADNSTKFKKSIANYLARKESSIDLVSGKIAEVDARISAIATDRQNLDKRLSFLLNDDDLAMAQSFRNEYKRQFSALNDEERELERKKSELQLLQRQLKEKQNASKSGFLGQVNAAINCIKRKDFVALRSIYRRLFEKIVVSPLENAKVELEFVLRNLSTPLGNAEFGNCLSVRRVEFECRETNFSLNQKILIKSITCITYSPIPEALLKQKYLGNHLSMREIAEEFSCSKTRIRDLLLKHNTPLRKPFNYSNRWYAYGKRRVGGKTIEHKAELRTIATIRQMHSEGLTTMAIARFLNTMKIPTKQQGKGWHQNTVAKILKREGVYVEGGKKRGREDEGLSA